MSRVWCWVEGWHPLTLGSRGGGGGKETLRSTHGPMPQDVAPIHLEPMWEHEPNSFISCRSCRCSGEIAGRGSGIGGSTPLIMAASTDVIDQHVYDGNPEWRGKTWDLGGLDWHIDNSSNFGNYVGGRNLRVYALDQRGQRAGEVGVESRKDGVIFCPQAAVPGVVVRACLGGLRIDMNCRDLSRRQIFELLGKTRQVAAFHRRRHIATSAAGLCPRRRSRRHPRRRRRRP